MTTKEIIAAYEQGARANHQNQHRQGNLIHLTAPGEVIMTGDLHGNELNFEKLIRLAQLEKNPQRHLILHELLHSTENLSVDQCHSYRLLARAAQVKAQFPHQLHLLLGNHAIAQRCRDEILKNGQPMVRALNAAISFTFAEKSSLVTQALDDFIMSLPLAVRTENRIWLSHSLPSQRHLKSFDNAIFDKPITLEDMQSNISLRALTWDRSYSESTLQALQKIWDVDIFVIGHQPEPKGVSRYHQCLIILASDHAQGRYLPFNIHRSYTPEEIFALARPIASLI
ncbi:MAG: hypothetical protein AMJ79_15745 [Phycisphaerae bacterium SM23_30]|nr:MAG: hypothetical protein AMJ79_15745 [Phycisphaerae bacterium SM23_30]